MTLSYILGSIIMMTMLGLSVGNYATSITFRLPRGLKIANDPPYCDSCRQYLKPRDLFPFFSWVANRARCRYCEAPIPALYAFVELACALIFNAAWFLYWPEQVDQFILLLGLGVFTITLMSLHIAEKRLFTLIVVLVAAFGSIYRVLSDAAVGEATIFNAVHGGYLALVLGILGWGIRCLLARRRVPFPDFAIMAGIAGLCVGHTAILMLMLLSICLMLIFAVVGRYSSAVRGSEGVLAISTALLLIMLDHRLQEPFFNAICNVTFRFCGAA